MGAVVSSLVSSAVLCLSWCFCSALGSVLGSCCGNDKDSTAPPSVTSGRKRSVLLLLISIGLAFAFQYGVAPALSPNGSAITSIPKVGPYLVNAWNDGCSDYETEALALKCSENAGALRVSACAFAFFLLFAMTAACKPTANREVWLAKYVLFLFLVVGSAFIPNAPIFTVVYLQIARLGGVAFLLIQQVIFLDLAYNLNESWVAKADEAELEKAGSGGKWLGSILAACVIIYAMSLTGIGLMFHFYGGCSTNEVFISITLVMSVVVTVVQLTGEDASLLTSAVVTGYGTYILFTAVSRNPNAECNPNLGDKDIVGIILGVGITLVSLAWTGWSYTAENKLGPKGSAPLSSSLVDNDHQEPTQDGPKEVQGIVLNNSVHEDYGANENDIRSESNPAQDTETAIPQSWKINVVLAMVSCWYGMALTGWGSIETGGNAANPSISRVSMWLIIGTQWVAYILYIWTIVAPRLFPDRDFS